MRIRKAPLSLTGQILIAAIRRDPAFRGSITVIEAIRHLIIALDINLDELWGKE